MIKTRTQDKEKRLLLAQAESELGYNDYWAGYPQITKILVKYGPYQLKQGKLVSGFTLQKFDLQHAIKDIDTIKDMNLTFRYQKHDYLLSDVCKKILNVLKLSVQYVNEQLRADKYKNWSKGDKAKAYQAFFSLDDGRQHGNVNAWAKPFIKTRRKQPEYQKARRYMQKAQNNWLEVTTQDDDSSQIYFISDTSTHGVTSDNIYNLLTKDFPW